jgi:hypothetical protein
VVKKKNVAKIVVEAAGGYEYEAVTRMRKADLPVALVNPTRVRRFNQANGQLAKNAARPESSNNVLSSSKPCGVPANFTPPASMKIT